MIPSASQDMQACSQAIGVASMCGKPLETMSVALFFRGGLILYRTTVKGLSLAANSVLDVGEPVRDYAKVGATLNLIQNFVDLRSHSGFC